MTSPADGAATAVLGTACAFYHGRPGQKQAFRDQGQTLSPMPEPPRRIYLDFNATAPLRPASREAMLAALARPGNASSVHAEGRAARAAVEIARGEVGALCGVAAERVTFTSGATEAAALALTPQLRVGSGGDTAARLLVGATEHAAVRRGHRFEAGCVTEVPVDRRGVVDLGALENLLARPGRALLALQAANGETGVVQPVAEAARLVHAAGGLVVCDAVQAAGRLPLEILDADVLLLSAHKLGGPQGVGAVAAMRDGLHWGTPLLRGGDQERGLRSGTENVAGISGFGAAARAAASETPAGLLALRRQLEAGLGRLCPDLVVFGQGAPRLPNTTAFAMPGIANDVALIAFDLAGFAVSTGSACASGKVSRWHALEAMGVDAHLAASALRVSLGWSSTAADVDAFLACAETVGVRTTMRPARAA